jgi:hypothetical protein
MNSDYPITEAEFRTWLEARRDSVVGATCIPWECPVSACVTNAGYKNVDVLVEYTYHAAKRKSGSFVNPDWVKQFITKLDNDAQGMALEVTGAEALAILDTVA